jgi:hypothetical protein
MAPFFSQEKAGIKQEHLAQFRVYRTRTWVFWGILVGTPQVYYLFLLGFVILRADGV